MHLKEGYRLHTGKYQLLNVIGEGGFSLTYEGLWNTEVHGPLGKIPTQAPVCIKEYFFKDYCLRNEKTNFVETNSTNGKLIFDKYKEKIIKEARILSEIHHPNVVKVLEVFKQNNTVYTVMEFISGDSLKKILEQSGVFKEKQLLSIIYKIGQALQYIHEKNILHLDIKPSNILMDKNNNPKLIDFGISKRYDLHDQQETSTSIMAASKGYASIEQYDSEGMQTFSPCPDVYSLGATMYFLLGGEPPTESILRSTKGLTNPRELNPEISENTERVILKAMELQAADRYQSVIEMITDLGYNPETDQVPLIAVSGKDDDQTELLPVKQRIEDPYDVDDETRIYSENEDEDKNTRRKKIWILSSIASIAVMIIFIFLYSNGHLIAKNDNQLAMEKEQGYQKHFDLGVDQYFKNNLSQAKDEFKSALTYKETREVKAYLSKIDSLSKIIQTPDIDSFVSTKPDTLTIQKKTDAKSGNTPNEQTKPDPKQEQYEQSFASALIAFNTKDYSKAKTDFQKAASYKNSPEVKSFINQCSNELEKLEVENRKGLYEFMMKFGTFVVVKRKSDNKFGAVDDKCIEKIPCIYIHSEAAGEDRAFLRQDELWDVYSHSGKKIKEGTDSY